MCLIFSKVVSVCGSCLLTIALSSKLIALKRNYQSHRVYSLLCFSFTHKTEEGLKERLFKHLENVF